MNNYYLKEFEYFNGEDFITFDIVDIDFDKLILNAAITNQGKSSLREFDLHERCDDYYFVYGPDKEEIYLKDFED